MKKGKLIVVSGPSGVGKDTVVDNIINNNKGFWKSVSLTTREKRENEIEGVDYYFVDKDSFLKNISDKNLIEYAEVYKDIFYGTPKDIVFEKLNNGINVVLVIDVEGAFNVKKIIPEAILIFILPPDMKELEERLRNRKTDSEEKINERIEKAKIEIERSKDYDYRVINNDVINCSNEILNIINNN